MKNVYLIGIPKDAEINERFAEKNLSSLPRTVRDKISGTNDVGTKYDRIYAYALLCRVLEQKGVCVADIQNGFAFDEKGKPYLKNSEIAFSLSHTDGVAAVAISESVNIGVDVERVRDTDTEKTMRVVARFCKDADLTCAENGASVGSFTERDGELYSVDPTPTFAPEITDIPFAKWTALEAVLKCHGKGFESLCEIREISENQHTVSAAFLYGGERYAISVSREK